eukprot:scaffold48229_cov70-Phaeocystis_antarctica.AAC.2
MSPGHFGVCTQFPKHRTHKVYFNTETVSIHRGTRNAPCHSRYTPVITLTPIPAHALDGALDSAALEKACCAPGSSSAESTQGLRPGCPHQPLECGRVVPLLIAAKPEPQDEAQPEPSAAMQRVEVPQADWGAPETAWRPVTPA